MITDETQIKPAKDYSLQPTTEQLIGAAHEVHNVLGYGFLERVYQLLVADKIIVELKTDAAYQAVHEAQLINELRGTGFKLGYLINFGRERVEYKRMVF